MVISGYSIAGFSCIGNGFLTVFGHMEFTLFFIFLNVKHFMIKKRNMKLLYINGLYNSPLAFEGHAKTTYEH